MRTSYNALVASLFLGLLGEGANSQLTGASVIQDDARLSNFSQLLDAVGVSPSIGKTVFAPSVTAFNKFRAQDEGLYDQYMDLPEFFNHRRELVIWHLVTEGQYTLEQIFNGGRGLLENQHANLTIDQRFQKVDNVPIASFVESDITTSDSIVHILDDVIIPPYMSLQIIDQLETDQSDKFAMTTMANLAVFAELDDYINDFYEKGITFLVPPNRRFNRAEIDVPVLLREENKEYTRDFVLSHLIMDNYHESGIFAYNTENEQEQFLVYSELGTHMWITTTEDHVRFQAEPILVADQAARNGIFHIMDMPVYPPFISDFTEFTAVATSWDTSDCNRWFRQTLLSSEEISQMYNTSLTMFCPTREAYSFFNNEDFQRLQEPIWRRHSTEFLLNHFTAGNFTREELLAMAPTEMEMLNGAVYELRKSGEQIRIKNTQFEQSRSLFNDLLALDGYLHIMDGVITPTAVSRSIFDQSNDNPDFSTLVENIDLVDLTDIIDRDLPLTFFAPNNAAFRRVEFSSIGGAEIIKRHLLRGLFFCDVLANNTKVFSVENIQLAIEVRGENKDLWVGGAKVYECDILARNGVLHYVDRVIGLDFDTSAPSQSPAPTLTAAPTIYELPTRAPVVRPTGMVPIVLPEIRIPAVEEIVGDESGGGSSGAAGLPGYGATGIIPLLMSLVVWMVRA